MDRPAQTPPPALGICRGQRLTNRRIAAELAVSEDWVSKVLLGYAKPPTRFQTGLAALVGRSVEELFRTQAEAVSTRSIR